MPKDGSQSREPIVKATPSYLQIRNILWTLGILVAIFAGGTYLAGSISRGVIITVVAVMWGLGGLLWTRDK